MGNQVRRKLDDAPPPKNKGGRPVGSMSRIAKEAREAAQLTGLLPHEILLSMARGEPQERLVVDPETGKVVGRVYMVPDIEQSKDAAKSAAPYFAPKISTVEVVAGMNDHELDRIIAQLTAEAGVSAGAGGEGQEEQGEAGADTAPAARRRAE